MAATCGGLYLMFLGPPLRSFWIRYCLYIWQTRHESASDPWDLYNLGNKSFPIAITLGIRCETVVTPKLYYSPIAHGQPHAPNRCFRRFLIVLDVTQLKTLPLPRLLDVIQQLNIQFWITSSDFLLWVIRIFRSFKPSQYKGYFFKIDGRSTCQSTKKCWLH